MLQVNAADKLVIYIFSRIYACMNVLISRSVAEICSAGVYIDTEI